MCVCRAMPCVHFEKRNSVYVLNLLNTCICTDVLATYDPTTTCRSVRTPNMETFFSLVYEIIRQLVQLSTNASLYEHVFEHAYVYVEANNVYTSVLVIVANSYC